LCGGVLDLDCKVYLVIGCVHEITRIVLGMRNSDANAGPERPANVSVLMAWKSPDTTQVITELSKQKSDKDRDADCDYGDSGFAHYLSRPTPLNFFAIFLTAINSPLFLSRLVEVFVSGFFSCVRSSMHAGVIAGRFVRWCLQKKHQVLNLPVCS
jgi:hypothetical protein